MKRSRYLTATDIAESTMCEQRAVFDHQRGKRRTAACRRVMRAGTAAHAQLHREAQPGFKAGDARCIVASALWGANDPRTQVLRDWRDRWLLNQRWGAEVVQLYYRLSPWLVAFLWHAPWLRSVLDRALTVVAGRVAEKRE